MNRGLPRTRPIVWLTAAIIVLLALILTWHLMGMDHDGGMGLLATCLFVAATMLLLLPPVGATALIVESGASRRAWGLGEAPGEPVSRSPPTAGILEGTVLLC